MGGVAQAGHEADLESLCAACPELVDTLRQRIRALRFLDSILIDDAADTIHGDAFAPNGNGKSYRPANPVLLPAVMPFGDLRHHARGGLGDIFRARDEGLKRDVAIKVIQPQRAASPVAFGRFERESEITGRLEHPGVAPVHAAGRCEDGRPYYVMRYIDGETLEAAIRRFHQAEMTSQDPGERALAFRSLLNRLVQACNTIDYAHDRGVLHRDIKPSNIMIGPYGETLVVDWGLAKVWDEAVEAADIERSPEPVDRDLTLEGSALGTPAYMALEQVDSDPKQIGPRTDVYGLGATLYCILTGQAPFQSNEIAAALDKIRYGEFSRPGQVNRKVPRPLEAICLRAMARKPDDRYTSAGSLARDLEHWLADEPVTAYHEGWTGRLARWARRHRQVVAVTMFVLITSVVALAITTVQVARARAVAEAARKRSEANGFMILQGITEPLKRLGNPDLERQPELAAMRRSALAEAAEAYEFFAKSRGEGPDEVSERVSSLIHLGLIHTIGGDRAEAMRTYQRAIDLGDEFIARHHAGAAIRDPIGMAHFHLGMEFRKQGHDDEAEKHFRDADARFVQALGLEPNNIFCRQHLAWLLAFCPHPQLRPAARRCEQALSVVEMPEAQGRDRASFSEGIRPKFTEALASYRAGNMAAARAALELSIQRRKGGDAYEWFVMALLNAREGDRKAARREYERAVEWTKWNRYGDTELHALEAEAALALGIRPAFES